MTHGYVSVTLHLRSMEIGRKTPNQSAIFAVVCTHVYCYRFTSSVPAISSFTAHVYNERWVILQRYSVLSISPR